MEDYELAHKLAREYRKDPKWVPYDSHTFLSLTPQGVPQLEYIFTASKGAKKPSTYVWLYVNNAWVMESL